MTESLRFNERTESTRMAVARRLQHERISRAMSLDEFSLFTGIHRMMLWRWETERSIPDASSICRLAERLNCSTDYLLGRTESKN
jgi:transcriptional regulator with XRE-family HTH domain